MPLLERCSKALEAAWDFFFKDAKTGIRSLMFFLSLPLIIVYPVLISGCISTAPGISSIYIAQIPGNPSVKFGFFGVCTTNSSSPQTCSIRHKMSSTIPKATRALINSLFDNHLPSKVLLVLSSVLLLLALAFFYTFLYLERDDPPHRYLRNLLVLTRNLLWAALAAIFGAAMTNLEFGNFLVFASGDGGSLDGAAQGGLKRGQEIQRLLWMIVALTMSVVAVFETICRSYISFESPPHQDAPQEPDKLGEQGISKEPHMSKDTSQKHVKSEDRGREGKLSALRDWLKGCFSCFSSSSKTSCRQDLDQARREPNGQIASLEISNPLPQPVHQPVHRSGVQSGHQSGHQPEDRTRVVVQNFFSFGNEFDGDTLNVSKAGEITQNHRVMTTSRIEDGSNGVVTGTGTVFRRSDDKTESKQVRNFGYHVRGKGDISAGHARNRSEKKKYLEPMFKVPRRPVAAKAGGIEGKNMDNAGKDKDESYESGANNEEENNTEHKMEQVIAAKAKEEKNEGDTLKVEPSKAETQPEQSGAFSKPRDNEKPADDHSKSEGQAQSAETPSTTEKQDKSAETASEAGSQGTSVVKEQIPGPEQESAGADREVDGGNWPDSQVSHSNQRW